MGIVELLRERETRRLLAEGEKIGLEKGLEKSKADKANIVRNLIDKFGFNDKQAASAAGVTIAFVKKYVLPSMRKTRKLREAPSKYNSGQKAQESWKGLQE